MDSLTGTGFPSSSPRWVISSTERRRAGASAEPTRKDDDSSLSASIATLGVSMLTTGIPLPGSAQTRLAQSLLAGISQTPFGGRLNCLLPQSHVAARLLGNPHKVARV